MSHKDYRRMIYYLVLLKRDLSKIIQPKYVQIINELSKYEVEVDNDVSYNGLPDQYHLAEILGYNRQKINSLLSELYEEVHAISPVNAIETRAYSYLLNIMIDEKSDNLTRLQVKLPIPLHVGEIVHLSFLNINDLKHPCIGTIDSISHNLTGAAQETTVNIYLRTHKKKEPYK